MGCIKCNMIGYFLEELSEELAIDITVQLDDSIDTFIEYKIESTPSLLINEDIKSFANNIEKSEIRKFILKHKNKNHEKSA